MPATDIVVLASITTVLGLIVLEIVRWEHGNASSDGSHRCTLPRVELVPNQVRVTISFLFAVGTPRFDNYRTPLEDGNGDALGLVKLIGSFRSGWEFVSSRSGGSIQEKELVLPLQHYYRHDW
jgi:hypothetical protein